MVGNLNRKNIFDQQELIPGAMDDDDTLQWATVKNYIKIFIESYCKLTFIYF